MKNLFYSIKGIVLLCTLMFFVVAMGGCVEDMPTSPDTDSTCSGQDLSRRSFAGLNLSGSNLSCADLSEANLQGTDLQNADLSEANLSNANLSNANLRFANLSNAGLYGANLAGADLSNANLSGANLSNVRLDGDGYLYLRSIGFDGFPANLSGANLSNANLSNANLTGANLTGANLHNANLSNANLQNANLSDANLTNANLSNANLQNAKVDFNTYLYLTDNQNYRHLGYISDEFQKALASDGAHDDRFGWSVSIAGDYAIIGAFDDDDNGPNSGSAYIFSRSGNNWTQQAKLKPSDGTNEDRFGESVSIAGDYAIIGARYDDDNDPNSGSAYIFSRSGNNWTQQTKLIPSDGASGDNFGYSVSIAGDYAIIGAFDDDDNGTNSGSAYIFSRSGNNWTQQAKLKPSDGTSGDLFGYSVSIAGDYAIIGAHYDDDNGSASGSAYIFSRSGNNWTQQTKLIPSDGASGDNFGYSVSIAGDYAIIGAFDDDNGTNSGSAYIFSRSGNNWTQQAKLKPSDGADYDLFGYSVSIAGDYAIIGAHYDDDNGSASGSAYIFSRSGNNWTQQAKLKPNDGSSYDRFGRSVSIAGDYAIIGAFDDDDNGGNSGSAYVVEYK